MTPKAIIFWLCIFVFIAATCAVAVALFARYLIGRTERLEVQNERKTELICTLNNRLDEVQADYNELEKKYNKLIERKAKQWSSKA